MSKAAAYRQIIDREHAAVRVFLDLLGQERELLAHTPVAHGPLSTVTEAKTHQIAAVESIEAERRGLADEARHVIGEIDDTALAERLGCRAAWVALSQDIAAARARNEVNGATIDTRLSATEARLAFLRQRSQSTLYASNGRQQKNAGTSGRLRGGA